MFAKYQKVVTTIFGIVTWVGNISLAGLFILFLVDICSRNLFSALYGINEVIELTMLIVGLAIVYATRNNTHVTVDIIVPRFKEGARRIVRSFSSWLSFFTTAVIAYVLFRNALNSIISHDKSQLLDIPVGYFILVFSISFILSGIIYLLRAINPKIFEETSNGDL